MSPRESDQLLRRVIGLQVAILLAVLTLVMLRLVELGAIPAAAGLISRS